MNYLIVGLNLEDHKEMLGMWLGENESASFWMSVMTDLRARGVEDILMTSTDNLKGFTEAIVAIFPQSVTQKLLDPVKAAARIAHHSTDLTYVS